MSDPQLALVDAPILKPEVAAYVAGLLDGEAYIGVVRSGSGRWPDPVISVEMCDEEIIGWLAKTFGGSPRPVPIRQPHHTPSFSWRVHGPRAQRVCAICLSYFRVKRKQVELLLAFPYPAGGQRPITNEIAAAREAIYLELKAANKRPVSDPVDAVAEQREVLACGPR